MTRNQFRRVAFQTLIQNLKTIYHDAVELDDEDMIMVVGKLQMDLLKKKKALVESEEID